MKLTVAIPTNADWTRLNRTKESLIYNTAEPLNVEIIFVDNGNTFGHDMTEFVNGVQEDYRGTVRLEVMTKRGGLTTAWKRCADASNTDLTIITNDDIYFMPGWDLMLINLLKEKPDFGLYLLCHPYNWSAQIRNLY